MSIIFNLILITIKILAILHIDISYDKRILTLVDIDNVLVI